MAHPPSVMHLNFASEVFVELSVDVQRGGTENDLFVLLI